MKTIANITALLTVLFLGGCDDVVSDQAGRGLANNGGAVATSASEIYRKCAACHGANGEKHALQKSATIGGESRNAILYQLKEYKAGRLDQYGMGQLMKGQVASLSESELSDLATYISKLTGQ